MDYTDIECIKLSVSKGLSFGIVLGSVLVKLPQILKILQSKSVQGLSFTGYVIETIAIVISLFYNYRLANPFSTYGEMLFLFIQNIIIMLLILGYRKQQSIAVLLCSFFGVFGYALMDNSKIPMQLLSKLQFSTIFLGIFSKLPQIYGNFASKSTGQLSGISTFLQFAGAVARVFTTFQEVEDSVLLLGAVVTSLLNATLMLQIVFLGGKKVKKRKIQ